MRRLTCFTLLVAAATVAFAGGIGEDVTRGKSAYEEGEWQQALAHFERARKQDPQSPIPLFGVGTALHQQGEYQKALNAFQNMEAGSDSLAAVSHYNQGNALARLGRQAARQQPEEALRLLEQSVSAYRRALKIQGSFDQARHNIEVVKHWIDRLRQRSGNRQSGNQQQGNQQSGQRQQQQSPNGQNDSSSRNQQQNDQQQNDRGQQNQQQQQQNQGDQQLEESRPEESAESILEEERERRSEDRRSRDTDTGGKPTW